MKLATVGDNCIDYYKCLNKGFPGGNPVNVGVYFTRLGGKASYTGVIGNDENGKLILESLREKNIDISHVRILPGKTAVAQVELINGERVFGDYDEGVLAEFKLSEEDIEFLCSHDMVVTGIWGMIEEDLHKIKEKGALVAFDFANKLSHPIVEKAVYQVDYAFFAYDKGDNEFIRKFMKEIYEKGPKVVTVTLGDKGSLCYCGKKFLTCGIVPCKVKDTMGAGDSYIAGFLKSILQEEDLKKAMEEGAKNAAITLQYNGAW
ncbi:fructoselysine 6-kinase [Clostridium tunisiense]|uniref:fructoselysine 6-kinase n=1 Tax=Clostridium tunisiense TaxID=219748 RepID=UPI00030487C1|nr:fructoselysine 6-kinase [Clostridium tunisiense]